MIGKGEYRGLASGWVENKGVEEEMEEEEIVIGE